MRLGKLYKVTYKANKVGFKTAVSLAEAHSLLWSLDYLPKIGACPSFFP